MKCKVKGMDLFNQSDHTSTTLVAAGKVTKDLERSVSEKDRRDQREGVVIATLRHKAQTCETLVGDCLHECTLSLSAGRAKVNIMFNSSGGR